jgi:hypothetical protein
MLFLRAKQQIIEMKFLIVLFLAFNCIHTQLISFHKIVPTFGLIDFE